MNISGNFEIRARQICQAEALLPVWTFLNLWHPILLRLSAGRVRERLYRERVWSTSFMLE